MFKLPKNPHFKRKIQTIYLTSAFLLAATLVFGFLAFERYQTVQKTWEAQYQRTAQLNAALAEMNRATGYGGFIHNFKNLILRLDNARYDAAIVKNIADLTHAIQKLHALVDNDADKQAVKQIEATFDEYITNYYKVSPMVAAGHNNHEVDAVVKVDDTTALQAQKLLVEHIAQSTQQSAISAQHTYQQALKFLGITLLIILLITLFGAYLLIHSVKQLYAKQQAIEADKQKLAQAYDKEKAVQAELKLLSERLLVATKASKLGVWDLQLATGDLTWNEHMYTLYELEPSVKTDLLTVWQNALLPEDLAVSQQLVQASITTGQDFEQVFRIRLNNQPLRHIQAWAKVVYDDLGQAVQIVGVNQDISEQIKTLEDLRLAKDQAEAANHAKDQFLANFSHEIRTPLNAIIGLSELGAYEPQLPQSQQYHAKIYKSGQHLLNIINDILDFSKIEAGKLKFESRPMNMHQIFDNLIQFFDNLASSKGIAFKIVIANKISPAYFGDELRLTQVLTNLIGNAIKFTERGSVTLSISAQTLNPHASLVKFSVQDTGQGIDPANQASLFQPFEQLDNSHTRKVGGTGLGLAISQRLVQGMGGSQIFIHSVLNEGAQFYFELPLSESSVVPPYKPNAQKSQVRLHGHILVVEDNSINQEVIQAKLKHYGLQVTLAQDGQEAIKQAKQTDFDLILMDIQMPNMDGYAATQAIRVFNSQIPIIALTAAARNEDREQAIHAGMNGHLSKPIESDKLEQVLINWLTLKHAQKPQAATLNPAQNTPTEHYLNRDLGLKMLDGNESMYHNLLTRLLDQLNAAKEPLMTELHALNAHTPPATWEHLQQQVHTLKGVTCTLAATPLCDLSTELDTWLKTQTCPTSAFIKTYQATFEATIQALQA